MFKRTLSVNKFTMGSLKLRPAPCSSHRYRSDIWHVCHPRSTACLVQCILPSKSPGAMDIKRNLFWVHGQVQIAIQLRYTRACFTPILGKHTAKFWQMQEISYVICIILVCNKYHVPTPSCSCLNNPGPGYLLIIFVRWFPCTNWTCRQDTKRNPWQEWIGFHMISSFNVYNICCIML